MKVPEQISERIKKMALQLDKDEKELKKQLIELYENDKATHKRKTDDRHWTIALYALRRPFRKDNIGSSAITFKGFIMGDTGPIDYVERMIDKAKRHYAINRQEAINSSLTNEQGEPLDRREQINFEPNPRYLEPLRSVDHSWGRKLYGVAGKGLDIKEAKFFMLNYNGDIANTLPDYIGKKVSFRATVRKNSPEYELNATAVTKIKVIDNDFDPEEMLRQSGKQIYRIMELEKAIDLLPERWDPILVEAVVHNINPEPHAKTNNRNVILDDQDLPMDAQGTFCYMPYHISLDFKEDSEVIFLAKLSKSSKGGKERVVMNGLGYYCPEDMRN